MDANVLTGSSNKIIRTAVVITTMEYKHFGIGKGFFFAVDKMGKERERWVLL